MEAHEKAGIDERCLKDNFEEMEKELKKMRAVLYKKEKNTAPKSLSNRAKESVTL